MDSGTKVTLLCELDILVCPEDEFPVKCVLTRADNNDYLSYDETDVAVKDNEKVIDEFDSQLSQIEHDIENLQVAEPIIDSNASFNKEIVDTEYIIIDEREAMAAMGLPTSFGSKRRGKRSGQMTRIGKEDFATFVMPSLKQYYGIQSLNTARPILAKMGYFYENRTCKAPVQKIRRDNEQQSDMDTSDDSDCETPQIINIEVKSKSIEEKEHSQDEQSESLLKDTDLVALNSLNTSSEKVDNKKDLISVKMDADISQEGNIIEDVHLHVENNEEESYSDYASAKSQLEEEIVELDAIQLPKKTTKKKKKKRKHSVPNEILQDKGLIKYYRKRYTLFSLYDDGIKLDREAWFSATPECIARHTANRLRCDLLVDAFCGTGGNSIQFAKTCKKVIAIDIDPVKIEMAKHNAGIYGVSDKIEFIVGNYVQLAPTIKADVVFLSPPWGGPNYKSNSIYDLEKHLQPLPASSLFTLSQKITRNIAMYLPKNSNTEQLVILAGKGNRVELEQNFLFDRLTAVTAYYGNLINTSE